MGSQRVRHNWATEQQQSKNQKKYKGKEKKYIIVVRHINIYVEIFYQVQKIKNRSILNDVINNLNIIDLYLTDLYFGLCIFVSLLLCV